jgi:carbamoyl-phosphate synthase small subunit
MQDLASIKKPKNATAVIVLADGTVLWGRGLGATAETVGEICFNTSMTGYQEILTDPSYAGQIITFTFPHIGNTGTNAEDIETVKPAARGLIVREDITAPSSWRNTEPLDAWLKSHNLPGIAGIDTRALTRRIRDAGAPNGVLAHNPDGKFDLKALHGRAKQWPGLEGMDLAKEVSCTAPYEWTEKLWAMPTKALSPTGRGLGEGADKKTSAPTATAPSPSLSPSREGAILKDLSREAGRGRGKERKHVVAVDYGAKRNILRCLASSGCRVTVVPCTASADDILALKPDGIFLSNGPGDPAATGVYAVPVIKKLLASGKPVFGICLGHQLLGLALGGKTEKMKLGHRGANQPVKDLTTGKVEITSQNHGFCVIPESLPKEAEVTHVSLFDGSNEGLRIKGKPVFSVQYHPEASPGPQDSHYLFKRFYDLMSA